MKYHTLYVKKYKCRHGGGVTPLVGTKLKLKYGS